MSFNTLQSGAYQRQLRLKSTIFSYISQESKHMEIDKIDTTILAELSANARVSMVDLAIHVGLSSTAIARRQRSLEENGFIQGYQAILDLGRFGLRTTVLVRIALESQSDQALKSF
jgi:Lrp/AsnC family transcriptional regulator, leucine-responsive regulatory protein